MKIKKQYLRYVLTLLLLIFVLLASIFFSGESLLLEKRGVNQLNEGWWYEKDQQTIFLSLPTKLDVPINEPLTIQTTLLADFQIKQFLLVRSSLQNVQVLIQQEVIYEKQFQTRSYMPMPSAWHLIEIPEGGEGKILSLVLESPFQAMSGIINDIHYGSLNELRYHILTTNLFQFVMALLAILIGLVLLIIPLIFKKNKSGMEYIGGFAIGIGLWILVESKMLQFFVGSQFLVSSLAYIMLSVFPIPLLLYLRNHVIEKYKKGYGALCVGFGINLIVILILQLLGIAGFFQTLIITHTLIAASILFVISTLIIEIRIYKNKEALKFLKYGAILTLFGLLELINFIFGRFDNTSIFILVGFLIFLIIQVIDYAKNLIEMMKRSYQLEIYEKLALQDPVTKGKNRTAFEKDLDKLFLDKTEQNIRLILFDINDLKHINDQFGHNDGDQAIQSAFSCIQKTFGDVGDCYRIGGDEFACLMYDGQAHPYQIRVQRLNGCMEQVDKETAYDFEIAIGSVVYNPIIHQEIRQWIKQADEKMYQDKQEKKRRKYDN